MTEEVVQEEEAPKPTLTFDDQQYDLNDLTEEQRYFVTQLQDLENQIAQLGSKQHQVRLSKEGFVALLKASLNSSEA
jgi:peptidoglycan hydrolase CwlO-like protein|tara:strand:- start:2058 stop:2288 length:231 start_codon:yes stop_codon:yes gene_type:complete